MQKELGIARELSMRIKKAISPFVGTRIAQKYKQGYADETFGIDEIAEKEIELFCKKKRITHITEDRGRVEHGSRFVFLIDPIDGTRNAMRGLPNHCVSIAIAKNRKGSETLEDVKGALIYRMDCEREHFFYAQKGKGAYEQLSKPRKKRRMTNGRKETAKIACAIGCEFGDSYEFHSPFVKSLARTHDCHIKVYNCSAMALAYLAAGRMDCVADLRLFARTKTQGGMHDIAAAYLIVKESGGLMKVCSNTPPLLDPAVKTSFIAAVSPKLFSEIEDILSKEYLIRIQP